jgi:signal transduction histidine kinase
MLSSESKELIRDIVTIFAEVTQIPIAIYETDMDGNIVDIVREDDRLSPPQRIEQSFCQDGLTYLSEPIIVDGSTRAVIFYNTFPGRDEDSSTLASKLVWARQTLNPVIQRVICKYEAEKDRIANSQQGAYHELNIRLQAVLAQLENMLNEPMSKPPSHESLQDILASVESMVMLMHGLTRGYYLPREYRFKPLSLRHLIDQAISLCRAEANRKGVEIVVDLKPQNEDINIEASELHLKQCFNNLLNNAVKYSYRALAPRKRFISVNGKPVDDGYEVKITNYGIGIETDEYALIFKDGYRGRQTKKEYRTGSGLGLTLVKQIIDQHHGDISVISEPVGEPSEGNPRPYLTRFTLRLPIAQLKRD